MLMFKDVFMIWIIIAVLLILLVMILIFPIHLNIEYSKELKVKIKVFLFSFEVNNAKNHHSSSNRKSVKKNKFLKLLNFFKKQGWEKSFKFIGDIIKECKEISTYVLKKINIKCIKSKIIVGADDAALVAIRYGQVSSLVYPLYNFILESAKPKKYDLNVLPNFTGDNNMKVLLYLDCSFNLFKIIAILFTILKNYGKLVHRYN